VKGINGSFSNVVGLPVERLGEELAAWDAMPPAHQSPTSA
jgi:predicted house-cleaning NTP pyrophosphatase (Maf/HAM1 superfamily)